MKGKNVSFSLALLIACTVCSCAAAAVSLGEGSLTAELSPGEEWLHAYSAFQKNPPQFSLWIEDESGAYVQTLYATKKIATQGWIFNGGNRRKEALPYWCRRRNVRYSDGLYLPTKEEPLTDAVTGATPKASFAISFDPPEGLDRFYVYLEINHSTDFNAAYPKDAAAGTPSYSGGGQGSGQPALVYRVLVDVNADAAGSASELVGHSSPDGSDGSLDADMAGIDSALDILGEFAITDGASR